MIDCLFRLDFVLPFLLKFFAVSFFMKLAHRLFLAVLFSFQRTIALSDLNNIPHEDAFVNNIILCDHCASAWAAKIDNVCNIIILLTVCQSHFLHFSAFYFDSLFLVYNCGFCVCFLSNTYTGEKYFTMRNLIPKTKQGCMSLLWYSIRCKIADSTEY